MIRSDGFSPCIVGTHPVQLLALSHLGLGLMQIGQNWLYRPTHLSVQNLLAGFNTLKSHHRKTDEYPESPTIHWSTAPSRPPAGPSFTFIETWGERPRELPASCPFSRARNASKSSGVAAAKAAKSSFTMGRWRVPSCPRQPLVPFVPLVAEPLVAWSCCRSCNRSRLSCTLSLRPDWSAPWKELSSVWSRRSNFWRLG